MDDKEIRAMNYYDGISQGYKELYHEEQKKKISNVVDILFQLKGTILDLGSGDGVVNDFIDDKKCFFVSCDLSFELLKINNNNAKVNCNLLKIPFKKEVADAIISFTVFQDISDPILALDNTKKILKPGGIFVFSFLKISKNSEKIVNYIENNFIVEKKLIEEKDLIYILRK